MSWLGVSGMFFLLGRVRGQAVPCRFCGAPDNDGHHFLGLYLSTSC